jgi:SAM-dependent methyltransferase
LRGLAGPGRFIPEAAELEALGPDLPPHARAIVELACLGRGVPVLLAREALGAGAFEALEVAGVLVRRQGRALWPEHALHATPFGWLVGDPPLGYPGVTPRPARAFVDDESLVLAECVARAAPVAKALDLGCGAGLTLLAAAESARSVVGVDVQAEAVRAAALGVAASGLGDRVEIREGDLFGALRSDERFDRIVAFLPALPLPAAAGAPAHGGGDDGSALSARVVNEAPRRLRDGGEVWIGAALLLDGERILRTRLVEALDESGATVAWSRGDAVDVDEVAEAAGVMLAGGVSPHAGPTRSWARAVRDSFRAASATALSPAVFRVRWWPLGPERSDRGTSVPRGGGSRD